MHFRQQRKAIWSSKCTSANRGKPFGRVNRLPPAAENYLVDQIGLDNVQAARKAQRLPHLHLPAKFHLVAAKGSQVEHPSIAKDQVLPPNTLQDTFNLGRFIEVQRGNLCWVRLNGVV